ncbi:MAG: protein-L-isoaspartate O-methyltransferase, partial [Planctomycetes bacterium]|nr:protein-L-isoaspartate O-methyltransferase [Planctomycetota bacterium]
AVVARMAQAVIAIEEDAAMAAEAQKLLADEGADNVVVHAGPLAQGAAEHGPYDVILIQGGVEEIPDALMQQLKDGGRIASIFMDGDLGSVRVGYKSGEVPSWRFAFNAGAPVLPGFGKQRAFAL